MHVLDKLVTEKPHASVVHVWAPAPQKTEGLATVVAALRRRRIEVRWSLPPFDAGIGAEKERRSPVAGVVEEAVRVRARSTRTRGERLLRKLGVKVQSRHLLRRPLRERLEATGTEVGT